MAQRHTTVRSEYCLHVTENGEELRFDGQRPLRLDDERPWKQVLPIYRGPDLPVHLVEVYEDFEETTIAAIKLYGGTLDDGTPVCMQIIHPKPHGRGWVLRYGTSDNFQIFRRSLPDPSTQRRVGPHERLPEVR